MALINSADNRYLRIVSINVDSNFICTANYEIYVNKEHRLNVQNYPYYVVQNGHLNSGALQTELAKNADNSLSILDNFKKAAYIAIHNDNFEFSTWEDDI